MLSDALGEKADVLDSGNCDFSAGDRSVHVATEDNFGGQQRETEIDGMPSYETSNPGQCVLVMKVVNDGPVWLWVQVLPGSGGDECGTARDVLKAVFDNLPDA
jgi:hypothetical protein